MLSASALLAPAASAEDTVKALFDRLDLMGHYAQDCKNPAAPQNLTINHKSVDDNHVQREQLSGPTTRDFLLVIDRASQSKPDELTIGGLIDNQRYTGVLRLDGKRMRTMESAREGGETIVGAGRSAKGGAETPWFDKCLGPESTIVRGTFPPERINADIEEAAQKRQKSNPQPALRGSFFKILYARNAKEFAGFARYSLMLLTVISQKPEELPLKRLFHRAGSSEDAIMRIMNWRSELATSMLARKVYGAYREDGYYLIPTGYMVRDGQLLIDYAGGASGVAILKLPSTAAPDATKNFRDLDPAPGAKPTLAVVQAFIRDKFPGFPVPTSLP